MTTKPKCSICKYCSFEEDADEEYGFGTKSYSNYSSWHECDLGIKAFNMDAEEVKCGRFREALARCRWCNGLIPITKFDGETCGNPKCNARAKAFYENEN